MRSCLVAYVKNFKTGGCIASEVGISFRQYNQS